MLELTINDNWYKQHPEKVLGEAYQTTGRFSDNVTKYRGDLTTLEKIKVVNYLVADMLSPHLSSEHQDTTAASIHAGKAQNIKKALQNLLVSKICLFLALNNHSAHKHKH